MAINVEKRPKRGVGTKKLLINVYFKKKFIIYIPTNKGPHPSEWIRSNARMNQSYRLGLRAKQTSEFEFSSGKEMCVRLEATD